MNSLSMNPAAVRQRKRRADPLAFAKPSTIARFWRLVDKSGPNGCWIWTGVIDAAGYGRSSLGRAHRTAYLLTVGPIAKGLFACHRCDNPPCCNPAHLFLGTVQDNTADMVSKGRHRPDSHDAQAWREGHCRKGHDVTKAENVVTRARKRGCLECERMRRRETYRRNITNPEWKARHLARARASKRRSKSTREAA